MARKRKKLISIDPYRFGDSELYTGMGSVGGGPFSMETFHPGQALGHRKPSVVNAAPSVSEQTAADLSIIEQIIRMRKRAEQELARRQLAEEGRIQDNSQRQRAQVMRQKVYEDRMADLEAGAAAPAPAPPPVAAARVPLDHGQDDPPEGAYGGRFDTGSSEAVIRGLLEEGERTGRVTERAEAGVPARGEFDQLDPQAPGGRDMIVEASKQPLYVTDDGEPIYMEDVIAVGGAARLRAISKAAKPIQEAFFKMIHKLKLDRHRAGKPPISAAKAVDKAAVPAVVTAAATGAAAPFFLGEGSTRQDAGVAPATTDQTDEGFDLLKAIQDGGISLTGGSASQVGVQDVAEKLIKKRAEAVKKSTLSDETQAELAVDDSLLTTPPPELDEVTEAPVISYAGPWAVDDAVVTRVAKEEKSTVRGSEELPDETRAALERTWGKWTYNPRQRRDRYMDQLNSIYRKGAWLDAIAALSGNPSRSGAYIQRAVAKMEAMQMFDQEERIYNIWRDVYFASDGTYDPPANKAEAARRARRLGASPQEVKKIYGWTEEEPDLQQWYRVVDGELETTQTKGKKVKPKGDGWIMGTPPAGLQTGTAVSHINWTDGDRTITLEKGQTPQGVGHTGDWYKGTGKDPGKVPGGKPAIDFIENVYLNSVNGGADEATAKAQAADARFLQYKQNPEMYGFIAGVTDDMMRQSALAEIENIIASFEARGRKSYSSQGAVGGSESESLGAID